jgi:hypothetical protein
VRPIESHADAETPGERPSASCASPASSATRANVRERGSTRGTMRGASARWGRRSGPISTMSSSPSFPAPVVYWPSRRSGTSSHTSSARDRRIAGLHPLADLDVALDDDPVERRAERRVVDADVEQRELGDERFRAAGRGGQLGLGDGERGARAAQVTLGDRVALRSGFERGKVLACVGQLGLALDVHGVGLGSRSDDRSALRLQSASVDDEQRVAGSDDVTLADGEARDGALLERGEHGLGGCAQAADDTFTLLDRAALDEASRDGGRRSLLRCHGERGRCVEHEREDEDGRGLEAESHGGDPKMSANRGRYQGPAPKLSPGPGEVPPRPSLDTREALAEPHRRSLP